MINNLQTQFDHFLLDGKNYEIDKCPIRVAQLEAVWADIEKKLLGGQKMQGMTIFDIFQ